MEAIEEERIIEEAIIQYEKSLNTVTKPPQKILKDSPSINTTKAPIKNDKKSSNDTMELEKPKQPLSKLEIPKLDAEIMSVNSKAPAPYILNHKTTDIQGSDLSFLDTVHLRRTMDHFSGQIRDHDDRIWFLRNLNE